jgi:hypothetical protein
MNGGYVSAPLQRRVRDRASNRCEYCGISQAGQEATFHVDHIRPRRDGGRTTSENLALACVSCSLRKGARTSAIDPETEQLAELFNPRSLDWRAHFELADDFRLVGRTPEGRATVQLLSINRPLAIEIRREEALKAKYLTPR